MYDGSQTNITRDDKGNSQKITLLRRVKQGDPLSCLLFDLIIDSLIEKLNKTTENISLNGENVSILAFADDMVTLTRNAEQANKQLKIIDKYMSALAMTAQAE